MDSKLLATVLCLAMVRLSEAAFPSITGGSPQTLTVDEHVANGATAFTLVSDIAAVFTLGGTDGGSFSVNPTTAIASVDVIITASPDFTTKPSYSFNVIATESGNATTVAITLNVNDNTPVFDPATYTATPCDGAVATTTVATVSATPFGSLTLTYSIASGNTNTDFSIGGTGIITVATSKTLVASTTPTYALVVIAADNADTAITGGTAQTGTTTVSVTVGCSGTSTITGSVATAILCLVFSLLKKLF